MSLKRQRESDDEDELQVKIPIVEQNEEVTEEIIEDQNDQDKDKDQKKTKNKNKNKKPVSEPISITCSLPPICSQNPCTFETHSTFELHILSNHTNICTQCKKNFPTAKLLDLHILENHNPFIKIKLEKGEPVFGCFVDNCDRVFKNHKKRRLHLIDKHDYPKDYIFSIVDNGIRKNDSSLIKKNQNKSFGVWKPA